MIYIEKEEIRTKVPLVDGEAVWDGEPPVGGKGLLVTPLIDGNPAVPDQNSDDEYVEVVTVQRHLRISPGVKMNEVRTIVDCAYVPMHLYLHQECN
jgi:hypothetical protein